MDISVCSSTYRANIPFRVCFRLRCRMNRSQIQVSDCGPRANRYTASCDCIDMAKSSDEKWKKSTNEKQFSKRTGSIVNWRQREEGKRRSEKKLSHPTGCRRSATASPAGMKNISNFLRFTHKYHKLIIRAASSMKRRFEFHFHLPFLPYLCYHIHLIKHSTYGRLMASICVQGNPPATVSFSFSACLRHRDEN